MSSNCGTRRTRSTLLFRDLLIGVTGFFRDPRPSRRSTQVIAPLFEGKGADDTVRVWVPGCSTGEEAYSIAILLREHWPGRHAAAAADLRHRHRRAALASARTGRYPAAIAAAIPPERLRALFRRDGGSYGREGTAGDVPVLGAQLDPRPAVLALDLISCRNLLIYLSASCRTG